MIGFLLINSSNPEKLKLFYHDFGLNFKDLDATRYYYGINNFFIILSKKFSSESRDLYFFKDNIIAKFNYNNLDPDEEKNIFDIYGKVKNYNIIDRSKRIIPIFRSYNIEHTSSTNAHLGLWTKEKHGSGSDHYCLSNEGIIVEIYPVRSKCPVENIELAFEGYGSEIEHPVQTITDPDGNNIILLD